MKKQNFLVLILAAAMTFGLSSCGSDNEKGADPVTSGANPVTPINPSNGVTSCEQASSFEDFKTKVNEGRFVKELNNNQTYYFVEMEPEINEDSWWIFNYSRIKWNRLGDFTRSSVKDTDQATHEAGNTKTAVRDYLMAILNQAQQHQGSGSYFEVATYSGQVFGIHLCYPIAANPVYRREITDGRSYFFTGTSSSYGNTFFGFQSF